MSERSYTEYVRADLMEAAIAAARAEGWQAANHAWQDWLEANIPDWDAMAGVDLTTLPKEPK